MIGNIDKADLIVTIKHARKADLTAQINIAVGELAELEGAVTAFQEQFDHIGPDMVDSIDITDAKKAAEALKTAGFGNLKAYAKFESRDDKARKYSYEVFLAERCDDDNRHYHSHTHSKYVHKPFTAEAKSLIRKMAAAKVQVQKKQSQLMALKSERRPWTTSARPRMPNSSRWSPTRCRAAAKSSIGCSGSAPPKRSPRNQHQVSHLRWGLGEQSSRPLSPSPTLTRENP